MIDIDKISGHKIQEIKLLTWCNYLKPIEIEKILIDFGINKLIIELDGDYDTIKPKIVNDFSLNIKEKEHAIIDSSMIKDYGLNDLIGKKIIWLWTMTNNQGYHDSLQIELDDHNSYQFMVECSFFKISKLMEIRKPSR